MNKVCKDCKIEKSVAEFPRRKDSKDGYRNNCKLCLSSYHAKNYNDNRTEKLNKQSAYRESNRERLAKRSNEYYYSNKAKCLQKAAEYRRTLDKAEQAEYLREYRRQNSDRCKFLAKRWKEAHKGEINAYMADRRARKLQATPPWADLEQIREFYKNCPNGYHVDHIFPLKSDFVCGLHTIENLQYLPASENISKGNRNFPER